MNGHQPTMRTPPTTDMYTAASFPSLASRPLFPNISANPTLLYRTVTPVLYAPPPYCTSLLYCNVNPKPLRCDAPAAWATSSSFCIDAQHTSRLGVGASTRVYRSPGALLYCTVHQPQVRIKRRARCGRGVGRGKVCTPPTRTVSNATSALGMPGRKQAVVLSGMQQRGAMLFSSASACQQLLALLLKCECIRTTCVHSQSPFRLVHGNPGTPACSQASRVACHDNAMQHC